MLDRLKKLIEDLRRPRPDYIPNWHKRLIPDDEVEPTRSKTPRELLEEHIEQMRQIPREP